MRKGTLVFITVFSFVVIAALVKALTTPISFSANILATLPSQNQGIVAEADNAFSTLLTEKVIFSVSGKNAEPVYDALSSILTNANLVLTQPSNEALPEIASIYTDHPHSLMTPEFELALRSSDDMLAYFSHFLSQASSPFVSETINADPSFNTAGFIQDLLRKNQNFTLSDNRLLLSHQSENIYFIIAQLPKGQAQEPVELINYLVEQVHALQTTYPGVHLRYSGAPFHNAENTLLAKRETTTFGLLSLLMVALLLFGALRTWKAFLLAHLSIVTAVIGGGCAVVLVFNDIHVLSLVFGVTLIGIAIDYCLHRLVHESADNEARTQLNGAITFGFFTTALGYVSFCFTSVALLSQVAIFVIAGLTFAWLFTLLVIPNWITTTSVVLNQTFLQCCQSMGRQFKQGQRYSRSIGISLLLLLVVGWALLMPQFSADVRQLNASSALLKQNEQYHFSLLNGDEKRFLIVANSLEQALQTEEAIAQRPELQHADIHIQGLSQWLSSQYKQRNNYTQIAEAAQQGVFTEVDNYLAEPITLSQFNPMTLEDFDGTTLSSVVHMYVYQTEGRVVTWVGVKGLSKELEQQLLNDFDGTLLRYNKVDMLNQAMAHLLSQLQWIALLAMIIICVLMGVVKGLVYGVKSALLLILICGFSLLFSYLIDQYLSIFSLLGVMLILALSADYFIFYSTHKYKAQTQYAVSLSALTSLFVFGILVFSQTPAIHSLGLVVMFGIILVSLCAPMIVREKS